MLKRAGMAVVLSWPLACGDDDGDPTGETGGTTAAATGVDDGDATAADASSGEGSGTTPTGDDAASSDAADEASTGAAAGAFDAEVVYDGMALAFVCDASEANVNVADMGGELNGVVVCRAADDPSDSISLTWVGAPGEVAWSMCAEVPGLAGPVALTIDGAVPFTCTATSGTTELTVIELSPARMTGSFDVTFTGPWGAMDGPEITWSAVGSFDVTASG